MTQASPPFARRHSMMICQPTTKGTAHRRHGTRLQQSVSVVGNGDSIVHSITNVNSPPARKKMPRIPVHLGALGVNPHSRLYIITPWCLLTFNIDGIDSIIDGIDSIERIDRTPADVL